MKDYLDISGEFLVRLTRFGHGVRATAASIGFFYIVAVSSLKHPPGAAIYIGFTSFYLALSLLCILFQKKIYGHARILFLLFIIDLVAALAAVQWTGAANTVLAMAIMAPLFMYAFIFSLRAAFAAALLVVGLYGVLIGVALLDVLPYAPLMPGNSNSLLREPVSITIAVCTVAVFSTSIVVMAHYYKRAIRATEKGLIESNRELLETLEEKRKIQDRLVRSQGLAEIGQLVAGVAHELNNPIGSAQSLVQSAVEVLEGAGGRMSEAELAELAGDLRFVNKQHARAREIITSLLNLARQSHEADDDVDLSRIVDEALVVLKNRYKYLDIQMEKRCCEGPIIFRGNQSQVGQVVLNLIHNAIQAVRGGSGRIVMEIFEREGRVGFACLDNGPGVPPEHRERIFEPFFTTKERGEGTGLGLYICSEIMSRHAGRIYIDEPSPERPGTRIVAEWPADGLEEAEGGGEPRCACRRPGPEKDGENAG